MLKQKNQNSFDFFSHYTVQSKTSNNDETVLKDRKTGELVLMKETIIDNCEQLKKMIQTLQEQKYLKNTNILSLISYEVKGNFIQSQQRTCFQLITLYQYSTRSMVEELQSRLINSQCFEESEIWSILCSLVIGLAYLQKQNIGHGCISLTDIFLSEQGNIRIVDPSLASYSPFTMNEGYYYSPEMIEKFHEENYHYDQSEIDIFKSDIFSLGMCLLHCCLLESCEDCYDYENCEIIPSVLKQKFNLLVDFYSKDLLNTIYEMLLFDVKQRPNFINMQKYVLEFYLNERQSQNKRKRNSIISPSLPDEEDQITILRYAVEKEVQNIDYPEIGIHERQKSVKESLKSSKVQVSQSEEQVHSSLKLQSQNKSEEIVQQKQEEVIEEMKEKESKIKQIKEKQFRIKDFQRQPFQNLVSVESRVEEDEPKETFSGKENRFDNNIALVVSRQDNSQVEEHQKSDVEPANVVKINFRNSQTNNGNTFKKGKIDNTTASEQIYTDPALLEMMKHDIAKIMEKRKYK